MRMGALGAVCVVTGCAVVTAHAAAPPARPTSRVVGCDDASVGTFRGIGRSSQHLRIGPLVLVGGGTAAAREPVEHLRRLGWWKMPALLQPGHTVTLRIAASHRGIAGWTYGPQRPTPRPGVAPGLRRAALTITLAACGPGDRRHSSIVDGRRVTFWSGGIVLTHVPACVPAEFWIDRERKPRRVTLSFGAGRCGRSHAQAVGRRASIAMSSASRTFSAPISPR
jgi:hypothetical protein